MAAAAIVPVTARVVAVTHVVVAAIVVVGRATVERPRPALVREQLVHDLLDRVERSKHVRGLTRVLAVEIGDPDRLAIEGQPDTVTGLADLDVDPPGAIPTNPGHIGVVIVLTLSRCHGVLQAAFRAGCNAWLSTEPALLAI